MGANPFSAIMESQEQEQRRGAISGVRYAEVARHEDEGYILTWLSGSVTTESAPARVATLMAGGQRGSYFMPEVGDEVVVGFEDGDLDKPVILGALWSDVDNPPSQADTSSSNNIRTIVSRSGHQLTFDDSPGAAKVIVKTNGDLHMTMDDQAGTITIEMNSTNKIEMSATGITVQGTMVTLKANDANKIEITSAGVNVVGTAINLN